MAHLASADKVMAELIARIGPMSIEKRRRGRPKGDAYGALLRAVVGQQLSVKAAATIFDRVLAIFGGRMPGAQELLDADEGELRGAGLSGRKVEYLKGTIPFIDLLFVYDMLRAYLLIICNPEVRYEIANIIEKLDNVVTFVGVSNSSIFFFI